jgi:hypothetical protein
MFRFILTLATVGVCALTVAPSASAATVTADPSNLGQVVAGHHPTATVTFTADPGMAFRRHATYVPLEQTAPTTWELVSTDCNGPLSQPGALVTSCSALMRVVTDHPGTPLGVPSLAFSADEFDPAGVKPTVFDQLTARIQGRVVEPLIGHTNISRKVFNPLVVDGYRDRVRYTAAFTQPTTGHVQVLNSTGRVVKGWSFSGRSMSVVWHGHNGTGAKVKPGTYRFRVVATGKSGLHVNGGVEFVVVQRG